MNNYKIAILVFLVFCLVSCNFDNTGETGPGSMTLEILKNVELDASINCIESVGNTAFLGLMKDNYAFAIVDFSTESKEYLDLEGPIIDFTFHNGDLVYTTGNTLFFVELNYDNSIEEIEYFNVESCLKVESYNDKVYAPVESAVLGKFSKDSFGYNFDESYNLLSTNFIIRDFYFLDNYVYVLASEDGSTDIMKYYLDELDGFAEQSHFLTINSFDLHVTDKLYIGTDNGLYYGDYDLIDFDSFYYGDKILGLSDYDDQITLAVENYGMRLFDSSNPYRDYLLSDFSNAIGKLDGRILHASGNVLQLIQRIPNQKN